MIQQITSNLSMKTNMKYNLNSLTRHAQSIPTENSKDLRVRYNSIMKGIFRYILDRLNHKITENHSLRYQGIKHPSLSVEKKSKIYNSYVEKKFIHKHSNSIIVTKSHRRSNIANTQKASKEIHKVTFPAEVNSRFEADNDSIRNIEEHRKFRNVMKRNYERDKKLMAKKFDANHPVIRLLRQNANKFDDNEKFIDDKDFNGINKLNDLNVLSPVMPRQNLLNELEIVGSTKKTLIKEKLAKYLQKINS